MHDNRSAPARIARQDIAKKPPSSPGPTLPREFVEEPATTLLDVWHFLGALAALEEIPDKKSKKAMRGPAGAPQKLFPPADMRRYREAAFKAMTPEDQNEAMLTMPSSLEMVRSFNLRAAESDSER